MLPALRRLLPYLLRYKRQFLIGFLCVVVTTSVALLSPWVMRYAIDDLTSGVTRRKLLLYAGVLFAIALVGGTFRFLMRRVIIGVSRDMEYDLRNDFFAHLQKLPLAYYQAHRTGDLMSRATNDLNAVRMMIGPAVMYSANTLIVFVVAIILMLSIDARLTLIALIPLPFVSISVKVFGSAIHKRFERIQAQLSDVSAVVQENLAGVRVVRAYRQEAAEMERFRKASTEYLERNRRLIRIQGFFFPSMSLFLGLGALLVLWLGSAEVIRRRITLGQFVAFNSYLVMLSWPMIAFGWVTNMLQRGMASWKRMLEVMDTEPAVRDEMGSHLPTRHFARVAPSDDLGSHLEMPHFAHVAPPARSTGSHLQDAARADVTPQIVQNAAFSDVTPKVVQNAASADVTPKIEFRDLTFGYDGRTVLEHVSARIEAGQTVALVGPTGSGKSTLIALLPRLFNPPRGTVFVDGVDVLDLPLSALRAGIGFVPQEPFLFSDTLADNIAFGAEDGKGAVRGRGAGQVDDAARPASASRPIEAIEQAAAIARLDKDVADFPKGYETMVGERGITLSGGQKQRTAIARALLIDPPILVLDDALSAVDTYTEEEILRRLRGVMRERTSIIVSHRVSTVKDADQILVLEGGRIVERGRHEELLALDGFYADLYRKQLLEEELAAE